MRLFLAETWWDKLYELPKRGQKTVKELINILPDEEKNINEDGSYTLKKYKYDTFLNIIEIIEEDSERCLLRSRVKMRNLKN